jgi:hypothetical protein
MEELICRVNEYDVRKRLKDLMDDKDALIEYIKEILYMNGVINIHHYAVLHEIDESNMEYSLEVILDDLNLLEEI